MRTPPFAKINILVTATLLFVSIGSAMAADKLDLVSGLWAQIDEKSAKVQSLVRIAEVAPGRYEGIVEKLFPAPGEDPNPRCEDCKGIRKDQPVIGMRIITGLRRNASDSDLFDGGEILDPDSGDTYRLKISILEAGQKLDVRGYMGIALFGRSQIWLRAAESVK